MVVIDWIFEVVISPVFQLIGRGLEMLILKPLDLLHLPVAFQVAVVAVGTGLLSMRLRQVLKAEEKTRAFQEKFAAQKAEQSSLRELPDWKEREVLYRASDKAIDEHFNVYLAQLFARNGMVYLLPLFFALFWLETVFTREELMARLGHPYVFSILENSYGIEGLPVSFVFLAVYVVTLIVSFQVRKRRNFKKTRQLRSA